MWRRALHLLAGSLVVTTLVIGCGNDSGTNSNGGSLSGTWSGSYSMVTNPGNDDAFGSISFTFSFAIAASIGETATNITATVSVVTSDGDPATINTSGQISGGHVTLKGEDQFAGQTHDYQFVGDIDGSSFDGTFTIEPRDHSWKSEGSFATERI